MPNLGSVINQGGEGKIHLINGQPSKVAKIFHNPLQHQTLAKAFPYISKLTSHWVKPLELIKNGNTIEGFIMDFVDLSKYFPFSGLKYDDFARKNNISNKIPIIL